MRVLATAPAYHAYLSSASSSRYTPDDFRSDIVAFGQFRYGLLEITDPDFKTIAVCNERRSMTSKLNTEFDTADVSPGLLLWRVTNTWQAKQRQALQPFGLTHVQFVLLASLTWLEAGEPVTQQQLAEHAKTDRMMTSQVVRTLENKGFVKQSPHPEDNRAFALTVTLQGREIVNKAILAVEEVDRQFFGQLGLAKQEFTRELAVLAEPEKSE
jgi:MarR family transcriptional regulator, organic hydroperoxide resistance regulator